MVTYLITECPYCPNVWRVKNTDEHGNLLPGLELPKSCPRCKRRFDVDWAPKQLKPYKRTFKNYREFLAFRGKRTSERKQQRK